MLLHSVLRSAKSVARCIRPIKDLIVARDELLASTTRLQTERDQLIHEREQLRNERSRLLFDHRFVPPGHFYSPIPAIEEVVNDASRIFAPPPRTLAGIDLREQAQLALLQHFAPFYAELPFAAEPQPELRYAYDNGAYGHSDAIMLFCMLRHISPKRVIEIGSGHSSCVILDTSKGFLGNAVVTTFIEPYPDLIHSLLKPGDAERIQIIPKRLQDVPIEIFSTLGENDILFVDSTHVGKIGSDVNYIFNEILPSLQRGVVIHLHDIFYPFEYPRFWIDEGRAWNEAYMLRCFLQYNSAFEVLLWNHFLAQFHSAYFQEHMPLCLANTGASIWLRRR